MCKRVGVHIPTGGVSRACSMFSLCWGSLPPGKTLDAVWHRAGQDGTFFIRLLKVVNNTIRINQRDVHLCFEVETSFGEALSPLMAALQIIQGKKVLHVLDDFHDWGLYCFCRCNKSTRGLEYAEQRAPEPGLKACGHEKRANVRGVPENQKEQDKDRHRHWHHYSESLARYSNRDRQRSKHHNSRSHSVNTHYHALGFSWVVTHWMLSVIQFLL